LFRSGDYGDEAEYGEEEEEVKGGEEKNVEVKESEADRR